MREAAAILRASQSDVDVRRVAIAHELDVIAGRKCRLLDALADGDLGAGVIPERLKAELSPRDTLTTELATLQAAEPMDDDALVRKVKAQAAEASAPLGRHTTQARQMIRTLLEGRLVREPNDERGRGYSVTARGTYRRFIRSWSLSTTLVAPTGTTHGAVGPLIVAFEGLAA